MSATPEIQTLIREAIQSFLDDLRVATPGIVKSYNATTRTASVQPAITYPIQTLDGKVAFEHPPTVDNVPCVFPAGGGLDLHLPLTPGDGVLLVALDVSPARWRGTGVVSDPPDVQRNTGAYLVAIGGIWTTLDAVGSDAGASIGRTGGMRIHFGASNITIGTGTDFVAMAAKVTTQLAALKSAISGAGVTAGDGGAAFKTAILAALSTWPGAIASTDLKAD